MRDIFRIVSLVRPYPLRFFWVILVGGIYSFFHMSSAALIEEYFAILKGEAHTWLPGGTSMERILYVSLAGVIILLGKCLFQYLKSYLSTWLARRIVVDMQKRLVAHLLTLDLGFFQSTRSGDIFSRLTNDMRMLAMTAKLTLQLISGPLTLVFGLGYLFWKSWSLTIVGLIAVPLAVSAVRILSQKMRRASKRAFEKQADATSIMVQFVGGIKTVKSFGREDHERDTFSREMDSVFNVAMKGARARSRVRPIVEFTSGLGLIGVVIFGAYSVLQGDLSSQELIGFIAALGLMYAPAKELSQANSEVQETIPAMDRIFEMLSASPEVNDNPGAMPMPPFNKDICFDDVTFGYNPENPVLHNIDLVIPKGSRIALVGPSGAGKSTLADLVVRFHDPQQGVIKIDNLDLRTLTLESIYNQVAIVSQEPFLFKDTIRYNIAYSRPEATEDDIIAAAQAASIHDEILALPEGYDTDVGERGNQISGGQRQRLCIARAILKNAPILILDEATSSLDTENEQLVQQALETLMENRTSLVIAHRLSTIRHADEVVVLQDGRIIDRGTHDELISRVGMYAQLWALQSGQPAGDTEEREQ